MENNSEDEPISIHGDEWKADVIEFRPGCYYEAIGFIHCSNIGLYGGDLLFSIWKFNDEPDNVIVTFRQREYVGPNSDAHDGGDLKKWHAMRSKSYASFEETRKQCQFIATMKQLFTGENLSQIEWLEINGDCEKATQVFMTSDCPWLHRKFVPMGEPNG